MAQNKMSICWGCARSCGIEEVQCSWFGRAHKLPKGAIYEERESKYNLGSGRVSSMRIVSVQECPEYVAETKEVKAKLKAYRVAKVREEHPNDTAIRLYRLMLGDGTDGRKK